MAKSVAEAIAPPPELLQVVYGYTAYPGMLELTQAYEQHPSPDKRKELTDYFNSYRDDAFAEAVDPVTGKCSNAVIKKLAAKSSEHISGLIQRSLRRLPASTLVFAPTASDPFAGWSQFWRFA